MSVRLSVERQTAGPLVDPAWGIVLRLRPFQFGVLLGMRAVMVETR